MKKPLLIVLFTAATIISCKKGTPPGSINKSGKKIVVTTLAGSNIAGNANGQGTAASFNGPFGVTVDPGGNVYIADFNNNLIRKISPAGSVTTLAGSGAAGNTDATGITASFNSPASVAADAAGNIYVADMANNLIRKIDPSGVVSTLAGSGLPGKADGFGAAAAFNTPVGIAVDIIGNVYVADANNYLIRKISPAGMVTTIAGNGVPATVDGKGTAASFYLPVSIAVDLTGNVYVADYNSIRKISPPGVVSTFAGGDSAGNTNGNGVAASFSFPNGIAVDAAGNVYVADTLNNLIRKITTGGAVTTLAGTGALGDTNGAGTIASFYIPSGIATDAVGNVYVADNNVIRKISLQ